MQRANYSFNPQYNKQFLAPPEALKNENPFGILSLIDDVWTNEKC